MSTRSVVNLLVPAAIVVVLFPLLFLCAALAVSFGIAAVGRPSMGMFGPMGGLDTIALGWTLLALGIVTGLVAVLVKEKWIG